MACIFDIAAVTAELALQTAQLNASIVADGNLTRTAISGLSTQLTTMESKIDTIKTQNDTMTSRVNRLMILNAQGIIRTKLSAYAAIRTLMNVAYFQINALRNFEESSSDGMKRVRLEDAKTATDRNITIITEWTCPGFDDEGTFTFQVLKDDAFPQDFSESIQIIDDTEELAGVECPTKEIRYGVTMTLNRLTFLNWIGRMMNFYQEGTVAMGSGEECDMADFSKVWGWETIPPGQKEYVSKWLRILLPEWRSATGGPM